jgi:hypothetical protein
MIVKNCLLPVLLLLVFEWPLLAQNDWTILKEKDGIRIRAGIHPLRRSMTSGWNSDLAGTLINWAILVDVASTKN